MTVKAISPKQSDTISLDDLKPLLAPRRGPCATLCLPTMRQGREQVQNSIRFKNLLRQLEDELGSGNSQARQTLEEMLGPARERLDDQDFWQHQSEGLAVYLAPGFSAWLRLPVETPELMTIGERFDLWPLLPALSHGERFFVLTLAQGGAKLWRCGRRTASALGRWNALRPMIEPKPPPSAMPRISSSTPRCPSLAAREDDDAAAAERACTTWRCARPACDRDLLALVDLLGGACSRCAVGGFTLMMCAPSWAAICAA
jgi:hypothetical protein